jgi:tRNA (cmo5U34)-methyltransferase
MVGVMKDLKMITSESRSGEFDMAIDKLVPYWDEMLDALLMPLSFDPGSAINMLIIGSGAGRVVQKIRTLFPHSRIVCFDMVEDISVHVHSRLQGYRDVEYLTGDIARIPFDRNYDAVVSFFSLHHLFTEEDKIELYRKIHTSLTDNGVFSSADIVLASNDDLQTTYIQRWKEYMYHTISIEEVERKWLLEYYEETRPVILSEHCKWLTNIGFHNIDIVWKYYNFAVCYGKK